MHILLTRPEQDAADLKERIEALGHRVSLSPLLSIVYETPPLDLAGVQALIATSRNGLKALSRSPALPAAKSLPIFVVGPGTAALARELGFSRVIEGPGRARDLAGVIKAEAAPDGGELLHLSGDTLAFDTAEALTREGFRVRREIVYRSVPAQGLEPEVAQAIKAGRLDAVILMSPRTANVFVDLARAAGLGTEAGRLEFYCLSPAVAGALAPLAAQNVKIARLPNAEEMLAALAPETPESF